jgi:hypothetical protein
MSTVSPETEIDRLIAAHGGVLARDKRHNVWKFPNGGQWVQAKTPSDSRAWANALSDLRKVLGIADPERGKPGERRTVRKQPPVRAKKIEPAGPLNSALADQLLASGAVERKLREEIERLTGVVTAERCAAAALAKCYSEIVVEMKRERDACLPCRLRRWWRQWTGIGTRRVEDDHHGPLIGPCLNCGGRMQTVRPGKWQCEKCG